MFDITLDENEIEEAIERIDRSRGWPRDRRRFLMAAVSTVAVGAGCSARLDPKGPTSLGSPTRNSPDEGVYLYDFTHEGDAAANIDVRIEPRSDPDAPAGLTIEAGPQPGWESTVMRFALRATTDGSSARILLEVADIASYPLSAHLTDDGHRVVELEGLDEAGLGESTIVLHFEVIPDTAIESLSLRSTTRWRSPEGALMEASFTDRLSMPIR